MSDFIILIAIIIAIFVVINKFQKKFMSSQNNEAIEIKPKLPKNFLIGIIVGIIALILIFNSFVVVSGGHIACIYDIGRGILEKNLLPGLHLKIPFWQTAKEFNTRTQAFTMSSSEENAMILGEKDDSMEAPTSDGQQVTIDVTVLFHLDSNKVNELWQNIGEDYVQKIVKPISRSQIRIVISRYTAIDIYSEKRAEAVKKMTEEIKPMFAEKGIILEEVLLRKVTFTPEYAKSIEEKQIAEQRIKKAKYDLERIEVEKKQKIVTAQGEAESIRLKGEMLRANPQTIQYEFVQKMAENVKWGFLPASSLPMIDLKSLSLEEAKVK
ncbi:prohibitin family protein [Candidatus Kuenenbacteria bacterium]|nr:prohibitin family protein [Candidatus Kuenenbacteria bacterium]